MTEKKKRLILAFLGVFFIFQIHTVWSFKDFWPFSALTMFANIKSRHFKVRAMLENKDLQLKPIPQNWLYPFGRYRTMALMTYNISDVKFKNDPNANFILQDVAERLEKLCRQEYPAENFQKVVYQYCDKCSSEEQNQDWTTVKAVTISCK